MLSNLINSGIRSLCQLARCKSQSPIEQFGKKWNISRLVAEPVRDRVVLQLGRSGSGFGGTADAVRMPF